MNPTQSQIAAIRAFVAGSSGWAQPAGAILSAMAADQVPNPVTRANVPVPYTAQGLLSLLSAQSAGNVEAFPAIHDLFAAIEAQDSPAVASAVALLLAAGKITADESAAITTAITATEPDPSWTATVAWDVATLGRACDSADLEAARPV